MYKLCTIKVCVLLNGFVHCTIHNLEFACSLYKNCTIYGYVPCNVPYTTMHNVRIEYVQRIENIQRKEYIVSRAYNISKFFDLPLIRHQSLCICDTTEASLFNQTRYVYIDEQIDRQTSTQIDKQTDRQIGRQKNRQTDRQTNRQIYKQTNRQIDK